ncbi:TetR/AcrR family transcriptional regulator [Yinghuangia seranimata]|uniref:TetR/AcrR family transcriptional regulator n=1 Tax=Yinghuangia seranimata TaxID=408067 RepID=UPI00248C0D59|nr:TetR/AcrR family transcriptional regulator [Yinghuangia seranimata]MDI2125854.1 helix-turn-helix domain-containing protein [Yinghuangia seranimata]
MPAAPAAPGRPLRADAQRNRDRIVAAAGAAVARDGADVSLEEVARAAQVGSATLHRHFPSRQALLEAVFKDRVAALCDRAHDLTEERDAGEALTSWLHAVGRHAVANRGLAAALVHGAHGAGDPTWGETCHAMITAAGGELLARARAARAVREDVTIVELLTLVSAICLATEDTADGAADTERLLGLALDGVRPR